MRFNRVLRWLVFVAALPAHATDIVLEAGGTGASSTTPFRTYIRGGNQVTDLWWTLPDTCGAAGDRLTTSGDCTLTWVAAPTGTSATIFTNKTFDGDTNEMQLRRHLTSCTGLTDGVPGEPCYQQSTDTLHVCEPTAGPCDTAAEWRQIGGGVSVGPSVTLDLGDDAGNDSTALTELATVRDDYGAASEPAPDKLVLDVAKLRPVQFGQVHFLGDTTCGTATAFIGPAGTCNASEAAVRFAVSGAITITGLACTQIVDTTCVLVGTVRDDGADTAAACTATNADTCNFAGAVAVAEDSLLALKLVDNGNTCTDGIRVHCLMTYTY